MEPNAEIWRNQYIWSTWQEVNSFSYVFLKDCLQIYDFEI